MVVALIWGNALAPAFTSGAWRYLAQHLSHTRSAVWIPIVSSPDDERDARPLYRFSQVFRVPLTTRWAVLRRVPMSVVCWVAGL